MLSTFAFVGWFVSGKKPESLQCIYNCDSYKFTNIAFSFFVKLATPHQPDNISEDGWRDQKSQQICFQS